MRIYVSALVLLSATGCTASAACAIDEEVVDSTASADTCPDPLSAYDPDAAREFYSPKWDKDAAIGGILSDASAEMTCKTVVIGLSTAGSCVLPNSVDLVIGTMSDDDQFSASLLNTYPMLSAEMVEHDYYELHVDVSDAQGMTWQAGQRPVVGMRVPPGACPQEVGPACGKRTALLSPTSTAVVDRTFVLGLEDCEEN